MDYLSQKLGAENPMNNINVTSFEVPKSFLNQLRLDAVNQHGNRGILPKKVDVNLGADQYELGRQQIIQLQQSIIQGSGQKVNF